jgi:hypothetical protein
MNDQPRKATRKARLTVSQRPDNLASNTIEAHQTVRVAAGSLLDQLTRFREQLEAMTMEHTGGWRMVAGVSGGVALTESRREVLKRTRILEEALIAAHGQQVDPMATPFNIMESDSPDGPWTPVPASKVTAQTYQIGSDGADATLCEALEGLSESIGFPRKSNLNGVAVDQGVFNRCDGLSPIDLRRLDSAWKALQLWCGRSTVAAPERVAESESEPESEAASITFTANERKLLKSMVSRDGAFLWSAAALGEDAGLGDETARRFIVRLCDHGLAERPDGDRRGARLTTRGRARAKELVEPQD